MCQEGGGVLHSRQNLPSKSIVTSLSVDADWIVVGIGSGQAGIALFSAKMFEPVNILLNHPTGVWSTSLISSSAAKVGPWQGKRCASVEGYGNRSALLITAGIERVVRVLDLDKGECKYTLAGHTSTIRCLESLSRRPIAISGSRDSTLIVWNIESGKQICLLEGHQKSIRALKVAGNKAASASYDHTCKIWNIDTGECLHTLSGHLHQLYSVDFDGFQVVTGSLDGSARLWSAETGQCLAFLQLNSSLVGQVQFTGSRIITGSSTGKVIGYSRDDFRQVYNLFDYLTPNQGIVELHCEKDKLFTVESSGRVRLWNTETGLYVSTIYEADKIWKMYCTGQICLIAAKRGENTYVELVRI